MASNADFINSERTLAWLAQFTPSEQVLLVEMLRRMRLVSQSEFSEGLRALILERVAEQPQVLPVGLYAEREVRRWKTRPNPLFRQTKSKPRRAHSIIRAIDPKLPWVQEVGSEGLVAQLITELARESPHSTFNHPSPAAIRKNKVRRFILIADFIGSGKRVAEYLDAAWRVWSVRSWWSARRTKGISFEVICYSATEEGRKRIEALPFEPIVSLVAHCPTIHFSMPPDLASEVQSLCIALDPEDHDPIESLGFNGTGALIAFAHGAPNNVPRILTEVSTRKRGPKHVPLFPKRITALTRHSFKSDLKTAADIELALLDIGRKRLARSGLIAELPIEAAKSLLVLSALTFRCKEVETVAGRTSLTIPEVERAIEHLRTLDWITEAGHLTEKGQRELRKNPQARRPRKTVPLEPKSYYYPSQLRAPVPIPSADG